jgi:hypothetical protein
MVDATVDINNDYTTLGEDGGISYVLYNIYLDKFIYISIDTTGSTSAVEYRDITDAKDGFIILRFDEDALLTFKEILDGVHDIYAILTFRNIWHPDTRENWVNLSKFIIADTHNLMVIELMFNKKDFKCIPVYNSINSFPLIELKDM